MIEVLIWVGPALGGGLALFEAIRAMRSGYVRFFVRNDPEAAIWREYQPLEYWVLIAIYTGIGLFLVSVAMVRAVSAA